MKLPPVVPATPPPDWPKDAPKLNARGWNHILYGEVRVNRHDKKEVFCGGHKYGYGWIGDKTEFPPDWEDSKIAESILAALNNKVKTGKYEMPLNRGKILVYTNDECTRIKTAYYTEE